jgi:hypothetical protein
MIGLGVTGPNIVGTVGTATGAAITAAATTVGGTSLFGVLGVSALAGPVGIAVGGIVAAAAAIAGMLGVGQGCGQTCVQATSIVNQAEPILKQNLAAYQSGQIDQATAISNYNQVWQSVLTACAAIPGTAGQNCVGDRQQGACHYKDATGNCWNWYIGYYVPLLTVVPSNTTNTSSLTSLVEGGGSGLMLAAALGIVGLIMVMQ